MGAEVRTKSCSFPRPCSGTSGDMIIGTGPAVGNGISGGISSCARQDRAQLLNIGVGAAFSPGADPVLGGCAPGAETADFGRTFLQPPLLVGAIRENKKTLDICPISPTHH